MTWLALVAFGSLLAGTFLLASGQYVWDAVLLVLVALGGLTALLRSRLRPQRGQGPQLWVLKVWDWQTLGAVLLSAIVGTVARHRPAGNDFTVLWCVWLLALVWFISTLFSPGQVRRTLLANKPSLARLEWGALCLLLVGALLARGVALGRIPANFSGDEGTQALASVRLVEPPLDNPFNVGWYSVPTMSFLFYGLGMRVFGATMAGARALSAVVGTLTVLTTFLLARALGGRWVGWGAALVLAFSNYHIHFSRLASNQVFDPLVGTLAWWLFWRAWRASRGPEACVVPAWGLAGMVAGVGWSTYFGARWVTFLIGLFLLWRALVEPQFWQRHWRGLSLMVLGGLVVVLPLLLWYMAHPADLTSRYNAVSLFASGWLRREMEITGKPAFPLLLQQLWKTVAAFHYTHDPTFWYYPQAPLVDFIVGALMLVGLVDTMLRWRWPSRGLVLLWFGSTMLMAWMLTENPPSSQRGLLLVPAVALLTAWGGQALWNLVEGQIEVKRMVTLACALFFVIWNLTFYFGIYTPRRVYGNPTAQIATEFARFNARVPLEGARVYFFGPPVLYWDFGTLSFLLRNQPGQNVLPEQFPDDITLPARFVFIDARVTDLDTVQRLYPGGVLYEIGAPDGRLLATVYDVLP